ncbi:hypothetical protein ACWEQL_26915 [Kitasatospora sp. NPDC004240]
MTTNESTVVRIEGEDRTLTRAAVFKVLDDSDLRKLHDHIVIIHGTAYHALGVVQRALGMKPTNNLITHAAVKALKEIGFHTFKANHFNAGGWPIVFRNDELETRKAETGRSSGKRP